MSTLSQFAIEDTFVGIPPPQNDELYQFLCLHPFGYENKILNFFEG